MHEYITTYKQNLTQKFHKILKNCPKPQKIYKNPKPRSKCMKCMKNEGKRDQTREEMITLCRNPSGFKV